MGSKEDKGMKREMNWAKLFQRDNLIILVLSGILLFIIALPVEEKAGRTATDNTKAEAASLQGSAEKSSGAYAVLQQDEKSQFAAETDYDYVSYLEQKLEVTLKSVEGVGKVEVMLTLQSSEELVVEKDVPVSRSSTNETDSEGGNRVVSQMDSRETTIYRTDGSSSEPYVVKTILPKVEGVLVVAEGAGSGTVNKNITEIVQALFGVEAHKVKVVTMKAAS